MPWSTHTHTHTQGGCESLVCGQLIRVSGLWAVDQVCFKTVLVKRGVYAYEVHEVLKYFM
jgi:hypothetical protein